MFWFPKEHRSESVALDHCLSPVECFPDGRLKAHPEIGPPHASNLQTLNRNELFTERELKMIQSVKNRRPD